MNLYPPTPYVYSRSGPLIIEPEPVIPQGDSASTSRSSSRTSVSSRSISSRSRSRSPASPAFRTPPVTPDVAHHSPRFSLDHAQSPLTPRVYSPLLSPPPVVPQSPHESDSPRYQPALMSSSGSSTPEIFIPPLLSEEQPNPPATDPVPVGEPASANATPWGHLAYPQFNYYPPQPYPYPNMFHTPYLAPGADIWPPPLLSTPYYNNAPMYSTLFHVSTAHNTPFPATPLAMGPPTPWIPTTPWVAGAPAVRINPRLVPGGLRWDLLHHPDQARYFNDWGALKAPKFSDDGLTMAPLNSGFRAPKVTKIEITSSPHPVLSYWMSIWGPIPLPHHKVFDILSAIYNYLSLPLTARETQLLLDTPQNVWHARKAKESRAKDSWALEVVILREEGYRRIDVIGAHRGFGGILVDKIKPVEMVLATENVGDGSEQDYEVEVELSMGLSQLTSSADENHFC